MKSLRRRIIGFGIVVMMVWTSISVQASASRWKRFTSEAGQFSILMPGDPSHEQRSDPTPVGTVEGNLYTVIIEGKEFSAEYSDLPMLAALFGSRKTIYEKAKEGLLKDLSAQEEDFRDIVMEGFFGRELDFTNHREQGTARFLLIGKRLYVLVVSSTKGELPSTLLEKYFASFQLIHHAPRIRGGKYWRG